MNLAELMEAMNKTASKPPKPVDVPGWGTVYVKEVTVGDMEEHESSDSRKNTVARAAARVLCDEQGNRLFDPANEEHIDLIAKQPWRMLRLIVEASEADRKNA